MAVGSVKMPSPCEGAELARSWSPGGGAQEPAPPVQLRQKLRELPALLRSGLTLRRKSAAAAGRVKFRLTLCLPLLVFCVMDQQTQCDRFSGGVTYGFTSAHTWVIL
ncbi:hypothetical protein TURU_057024 [Turdus rufiventris]|nr:hypothetical protein TURU_057024 [Turdus rufiventris]